MNALPATSIRTDRHVASYVRLGPDRPDVQPTANLPPRTAAQVLADRDAAQADREALEASRADLMMNGTAEELLALDTRIALAKVRQDQAQTQHSVLIATEAKARAENETEQTRRKALRKAGMKASAEAGKLVERYVALATEMAALLGRLRDYERTIIEANQNLPADAEPVPFGEPDNGKPGIPSSQKTTVERVFNGYGDGRLPTYRNHPTTTYSPGRPAEPHKPLSGRPYLPGVGPDAAPIWGAREYINGEAR